VSGISLTLGAFVWGCGQDDQLGRGVLHGAATAPRLDRPELIAFRTDGSVAVVRYALVAARGDGTRVRMLVSGTDRARWRPALFEGVAWAPGGRRAAFTAELGRELAACRRDIYVMGARGRRQRRLTRDGRSFHPVWAPGGRRIFFARRPKGSCGATASIWSMRPDGSDRRRVTQLVVGRSDVPGSLSPDGRLLAFTRRTFADIGMDGRVQNTAEVWVTRRDGSEQRRLAERSAEPAFSPDGRTLAFVSDRDENGELSYGDLVRHANELYVAHADGSHPKRLTRTRSLNEAAPSWLPSGTRIAYQRGRVIDNAQGTVVMQANANGSCPTRILADPRLATWYAAPAWRPGTARRGAGQLGC
jgi:Tol biopolymer transport system component